MGQILHGSAPAGSGAIAATMQGWLGLGRVTAQAKLAS